MRGFCAGVRGFEAVVQGFGVGFEVLRLGFEVLARGSWGGPQASHPEVPKCSQIYFRGPPWDTSETLTFAIRSRLCMFFCMSEKLVQQEGG